MKKGIVVGMILFCSVAQAYSVKTKTISENGTAPRYTVAAQYPVLKGLHSKDAEAALNDWLAKWALAKVTLYRNEIATLEAPDAASRMPGENRLSVSYTVKVKTDHVLGVVWDVYQSLVGSAHPSEVLNPMMVNLDTGRPIALVDLFKPGSAYLKRLSQFCTAQLTVAAANAGYPLFEEGLKPIPKNYENFLMRPEGLYFVFNPYQVAPYVAGVQEVTVPYAVVADLLQSGGPVALLQQSR